ncbi:MAG: hypothetical protein ACTSPI_09630, partial [Candidatus Heimdallarchaeaceae archaeon]
PISRNSYHYELDQDKLNEIKSDIEISVPSLPEVSVNAPYKIPVRMFNHSDSDISGTLVIAIERGGIFTNQLYPRNLKRKSNVGIMVEIPAPNFLGKVKVNFIFQDNTGKILAIEEKNISFQ